MFGNRKITTSRTAEYINNPLLSSFPEANSYYDTTGDLGVDFSGTGTTRPHPTYTVRMTTQYTGLAQETARQKFITAQITDPGVEDYVVGYIADGQLDELYPGLSAGNIQYLRAASERCRIPTTVSLDDVLTPGQTNNIGVFSLTGNNWGQYNYIPLVDADGNLLPVTLTGHQTLRVTLTAGGENMNFFMSAPAVQPSH